MQSGLVSLLQPLFVRSIVWGFGDEFKQLNGGREVLSWDSAVSVIRCRFDAGGGKEKACQASVLVKLTPAR